VIAHRSLEHLRQSYRPDDIRVLFVGESPPAGGTFFYKVDSNLARYTQQAFSQAFERQFASGEAFLRFFKALGCYLDDLCLAPLNRLDKRDRKRHRTKGVGLLTARMRTASPQAVVSVMLAIAPQVRQAVHAAGLHATLFFSLPFPALGNQRRYLSELIEVLQVLKCRNVLEEDSR
jgi:hypothetical protein